MLDSAPQNHFSGDKFGTQRALLLNNKKGRERGVVTCSFLIKCTILIKSSPGILGLFDNDALNKCQSNKEYRGRGHKIFTCLALK